MPMMRRITRRSEIDISYQGAAAGLTDYIDWQSMSLDCWTDLQSYLSRASLPDRLVAEALLSGETPRARLMDRVPRVHRELLSILR